MNIDSLGSSGHVRGSGSGESTERDGKRAARAVRGGSITFHKIGLSSSTSSGASSASTSFMLAEHLFDTMHRLNHSFIDVLKIDVEGAEWAILPSLLAATAERGPAFGQLLVELHYQSVPAVLNLFAALSQRGFVSFSREVNLQPCLAGQLPRAIEFSFIHPRAFFDVSSRPSLPPAAVTPSYHQPISAVIYFLTQKRRVKMMAGALLSLYINFIQQFPHYPIL
jgi:hypothetical protein